MSFVKIIFLCLIFHLSVSPYRCNATTLPAKENTHSTTTDNTAMAKTSSTIMDVFEDIRWFFERLARFCDIVERMFLPEKTDNEQLPLSIALTFQTGLRHFIFGVREISKSIVRVLSDKEVREYKQLSRATDFAQDVVKNVADFFRNMRGLIGNILETYTFYIPEIMLTKCMKEYLIQSYPDRPLYEYPIILTRDIIDAFRTSNDTENEIPKNATPSANERKLSFGSLLDKNVEQNEILDDELYIFHNTPVSPSPELAIKNHSSSISLDEMESHEKIEGERFNWKRCVQMYATETIFRKIEFYFMKVNN